MPAGVTVSSILPTRLDLDCHVHCADGPFGELSDVVIDPRTRCLTHLVVQPHHRHRLARLVPVSEVQVDGVGDGLRLGCTIAEIHELEPVQDSEYLRLGQRPTEEPNSDIGIEEVAEMPPYQSFGSDTLAAAPAPMDFDPHVTVTYDRVPRGTVEIRRQSEVISSDGHYVGHVVGLVFGDQQRIVEFVIHHGHLWSKREIAIPIDSIERLMSDEIVLRSSHDEVTG